MTVDELVDDAKTRMDKSVEAMRHELTGVRTGRASAALLDRVQVDYYGTRTPLNQLAQISVPDARLLTITPYDKSAIKEIERAVLESDLGLNPANDGNVVRLPCATCAATRCTTSRTSTVRARRRPTRCTAPRTGCRS
jgi:ribosome recycling factor